jgi:hypothetical protein
MALSTKEIIKGGFVISEWDKRNYWIWSRQPVRISRYGEDRVYIRPSGGSKPFLSENGRGDAPFRSFREAKGALCTFLGRMPKEIEDIEAVHRWGEVKVFK